MHWFQKQITLHPRPRGFHVITREISDQLPELGHIKIGMAQIFIKHTSASLTLNENVSPDVRDDMESHLNEMIPENAAYYTHIYEGPDDMPAHIKASLLGSSLMLPITNGAFNLGTWQGIYLCEHRDHGGARKLVITLWGE